MAGTWNARNTGRAGMAGHAGNAERSRPFPTMVVIGSGEVFGIGIVMAARAEPLPYGID